MPALKRLPFRAAAAVGDNAATLLLALLLCGVAVFFGLLATTANPILIGLAVGLFGGIFLLAAPRVTVWLILGLGLGSGALLSLAGGGLDKVSWAISMMAFLLFLPALMRLLRYPQMPAFAWLALLFIMETVFSALLERHSLGEYIIGFKRYFQASGLMLALAVLAFSRKDFDRWLKLLFGIALLQLPFAVYERFVLVPMRGNSPEAMDVVAGTLGASIVGGSPNSVMALFVLVAFAFVFMRWRAGALPGWKCLFAGALLLAPLGLGETKIVVVMIPLIGMVLLRREFIRNPIRYLPLLAAFAMLTFLAAYVYVFWILDSTFYEVVSTSLRYNTGEQGYGNMYLNRTTVVTFWWSLQGLHDPLGFLFGHGLGSSYGFLGNTGHIAAHYPMHGIGLTTISTLLWDTGAVGFALYVAVFASAWLAANRLLKSSTDPVLRGDVLAIQSAIAQFALFMLYSDSQVNLISMELIVASVLGYLAFLLRENAAALRTGSPPATSLTFGKR